jgi:glycosyltransferase involved in cell wall biosynthesis
MFQPRARYTQALTRIAVLHRGPSPTMQSYLRPRFAEAAVPVAYYDLLNPLPPDAFSAGTFVIVVRYLTFPAARALRRARAGLSGVAYLMDDDIPQAHKDPDLPRDYAYTMVTFWTVFRPILARLCSEIWVTSPGLEQAYGGAYVHRINPLYVGPAQPRARRASDQPARIFYHGGRTHSRDKAWLAPIIARVQSARDETVFETFGDREVVKSFAGVPRCRVLHRMPWPDYLSYAAAERFDIGLAPAVPGTYNAARSFNKAYDITRCGAAGVYADVPSFREFVTHGRDGLLVDPCDPDAWERAIHALLDDPALRRRLHAAALERCRDIAAREKTSDLMRRLRAHTDGDGA